MPARTAELQARLRALGLDPGPTDGIYGTLTEEAVFDSLDLYAPKVAVTVGLVPDEWMPPCKMQRVICHWTAGAWTASSHDVDYYHILVNSDGSLVRGSYSIKDNENTSDGRYAAHTKNCNTGSIGISLCCMANAVENPFDAGKYPMTSKQWAAMCNAVAELCDHYMIVVGPKTVLSHAEVQGTLGIAQAGKWDYTRLAYDLSIKGATQCGDKLRREVTAAQKNLVKTAVDSLVTLVSPSPSVLPEAHGSGA